ncbi:MAG: 2-amino-4-hydroxy-6-hydroxymethyldihydropteridine diphosphokinase [Bacteroidales bacterium]|nr:2-amino-4-hydroxy-6-hydroxymethyldihydropteridine diphosphokinase [Bacteroidales bacterium]
MSEIVILLGSNLGARNTLLQQAGQMLETELGSATSVSSVYESEAWGFDSTDTFLNQIRLHNTSKTASEVLKICQNIEHTLGRTRKANQYESRTIDLDLLFRGSEIIHTVDLQIPHPRLHLRRFTLVPLAELMPDFIHPIFKKNMLELLEECTDNLTVTKFEA